MPQVNNKITIRLQYKDKSLVIPLNPRHLEIKRPSRSRVENVIGIGDIAVPQEPGLASFVIESFFSRELLGAKPYANDALHTPKQYADWFKTWQRSAIPARFTVDELGYHVMAVCESFDYDVRAGEEEDVYYTLSMREYRPYAVKTLEVSDLAPDTASAPPETRPENAPAVSQSYVVQNGDSLWSVAKRLSGSGSRWRELYDANISVIGSSPDKIYPGQTFIVPPSWVTA